MAYKIERRILEDAPALTVEDVMTITEAARELSLSHSAVNNLLVQERLTTVVDPKGRTAYLRPRRMVLRTEVAHLKAELDWHT